MHRDEEPDQLVGGVDELAQQFVGVECRGLRIVDAVSLVDRRSPGDRDPLQVEDEHHARHRPARRTHRVSDISIARALCLRDLGVQQDRAQLRGRHLLAVSQPSTAARSASLTSP